jgi:hypothetical protein
MSLTLKPVIESLRIVSESQGLGMAYSNSLADGRRYFHDQDQQVAGRGDHRSVSVRRS